jgi:hypothetical protein
MPEPKRRLKVFLCHAHSDATAVRDLFRYLRREGVDAWLDKEKLLPGVDWDREIRKAVRESDVVVVCLSKNFNQEGFRQKEVRIALGAAMYKLEGQIFIIPARLEPCEVPENLSKWQWVDLFEEGGRQKLIYALRARADSVGAALRRRSRRPSDKSVPQKKEDKEGDALSTPGLFPLGTATYRFRDIIPVPGPSDDSIDTGSPGEQPLPRRQDRTKARSGIWMDDSELVWRDTTRLGRLDSRFAQRMLAYLIENRGVYCSISDLFKAAYGKDDFDSDPVVNGRAVEVLIEDIRQLVERDAKKPQYIRGVRGMGYILEY